MPDAVYSEINFHITWHTKSNLPLITPAIETKLYSYLKHKIIETPEVYFHAVGGIEDHVHIVISAPPSLLISDWIGKLKGGSSFEINRLSNHKLLQWQRGYGIVSFGTKDLKWVIDSLVSGYKSNRFNCLESSISEFCNGHSLSS